MPTNFPTSLDSLTNPLSTDALNNPSHSGQHANANDAIEALEAKVGINSSAVTTSHDYKISQLETTRALVGSSNTFTANQIISASSTSDLLRITQTGTGNALVVEDETNPDSTPFVVTGAGRVGIGMTTPGVALQVQNTTQAAGYFDTLSNNSAISLRRNNGTFASPTTVASGETIGTYDFLGHDGTSYRDVARVSGVVDAAVSTGVVPGRLIFSTTNASGTLTERMRIDSSGQVGIGVAPAAGRNLTVSKAITGSTQGIGILVGGQVQSDVTAGANLYRTAAGTQDAVFTLASLRHFLAAQSTFGASSTVTEQIGFYVDSTLTGATNNFAFVSNLAAGTGRWNLFMGGTANNYLAGRLGVGATLTSGTMAQVTNTTAADKALVVKGAASQSGNYFEVQNSAGTALIVADSSGRLVAGHTAAVTFSGSNTARVQSNSTDVFSSGFATSYWADNTNPSLVHLAKSRGTSIATRSAVLSGDEIGRISFDADDGTNFIPAAMIRADVAGTPATNDMPGRLLFLTTADGASSPTERMRIDSTGAVGIGTTPAAGRRLVVAGNLTGAVTSVGLSVLPTIQSDVTTNAYIVNTNGITAAAAFTLASLQHFRADQGTFGAGSTVTDQYGFIVGSSLTGATNNYGFYGNLPAATGRWNLYMNGTANNFLAGSLGIGSNALTGYLLRVFGNVTGATTAYAVRVQSTVQSDVTATAVTYDSTAGTQAAAFTLTDLSHFRANQTTFGASSTVTTQIGFSALGSLTGATQNYGFYGGIASGTGRFNLYMGGTADNYLAGRLGVGATLTSGAMALVTNATAADKVLVVRGAASQTGTLFEAQNSAGTALIVADSSGQLNIGGTPAAGRPLTISKAITGAAQTFVVTVNGGIQSDVTTEAQIFRSAVSTQAASFTLPGLTHFVATGISTPGAGSTITNQYGFFVTSTTTGATNNYGFFGDIASGTNRWNLYMNGTANNYLAGNLMVGTTTLATSSEKTIHIANGTAPTANPTNAGVLYVESGALKYRGSSGTVTTLANA